MRGPLRLAALGWAGHNQVFRLDTVAGSFAVKRYGRPLASDVPAGGFAIERAAYEGGVPMPRPVPALTGA